MCAIDGFSPSGPEIGIASKPTRFDWGPGLHAVKILGSQNQNALDFSTWVQESSMHRLINLTMRRAT